MNNKKRHPKGKQTNTIFFLQHHFYGKILLFVLSGAVMIGHGGRMLYQGIFVPGSSYSPNTFDLFFDWLTLAILGCFILWFALTLWYQGMGKKTAAGKRHIH